MWLFTTDGFFSAVNDRNDEGTIIVRSRVRDDAARLVDAVGVGRIIETRDSDYRFRVRLPRAAWVAYVAAAAEAIDYSNFKAAVAVRQGASRAHAYADVWAVLRRLQATEERR
jgi:hypothetical protein